MSAHNNLYLQRMQNRNDKFDGVAIARDNGDKEAPNRNVNRDRNKVELSRHGNRTMNHGAVDHGSGRDFRAPKTRKPQRDRWPYTNVRRPRDDDRRPNHDVQDVSDSRDARAQKSRTEKRKQWPYTNNEEPRGDEHRLHSGAVDDISGRRVPTTSGRAQGGRYPYAGREEKSQKQCNGRKRVDNFAFLKTHKTGSSTLTNVFHRYGGHTCIHTCMHVRT